MRDPGCQLYRLPMASKARLVLHFDINKTVLMADRAQGASTACVVNMLLSVRQENLALGGMTSNLV